MTDGFEILQSLYISDANYRCIHYDKTPNTYANGKAVCESLFGQVYEPRDEDHARKVYDYAASVGYLPGKKRKINVYFKIQIDFRHVSR